MGMNRNISELLTVTVSASIGSCTPISFGDFASASIIVPSGSSLGTLTFYGCETLTGTYVQIYDSSNAAVSRTVGASRAYALPDECFGFRFLKIVGDTSGTVLVNCKS